MKSTCFAASVGLAFLAAFVSTDVLAAAGRTPGNFAVAPDGSSTYSIPIWTPPGPNGLQPQISLVYDSRGGSGSEGVGWSVAGLSSIYLCGQTIAQDGVAAATGVGSQRFCMDGKRLRLTSSDNLSTYGQDGTTYQTEIADFSNVTAHGTGPAYFTVQLRNGLTYEYGNTSTSKVLNSATGVPLDWMLDKVTDRAGNTMVIAWEPTGSNLSGTTIPASISWTPTSYGASQYSYTMLFNYSALSNAQQAGYVAGMQIQNFDQLTSIEIQYASGGTSSDVKAYMLDYSVSSTTGREILTTVTECTDTTRANCLSPTTMTYQPGQQGVTASPASSMTIAGAPSFAFDLNGDGINDYVTYTSSGAVQVAFGSASGYQSSISTPITTQSYSIGYIDGTTTASLLTAQGGVYVYYKWNGSSFVATSTGVTVAPTGSPFTFPILIDVNGDGLDDLVYTDSSGELFVQMNTTATGGAVQFAAAIDAGPSTFPGSSLNGALYALPGARKFDFTGDGQADILVLWTVSTPTGPQFGWSGLHFTGSTFTAVAAGASGQPGSVVDVGDYNDDGCMDVLFTTELTLSGCNGSYWSALSFGPFFAVAGLNWDGGTRRAVAVNNGGQIQVYKSLGNTLAPAIQTGIPYDSTKTYTAAPNPTGDGLDALALYGRSAPAEYYLHNGAGQPPDLLTSVTDGFNNFAKPTYASIAQSNYTIGTSTHTGYQNYIGPRYVVNQVTFSDPSSTSGGTYQQTFQYFWELLSLQGRGFSGFNFYSRYDSRTGTYERFGINVGFPGDGMFAFDLPSFDQAANQPIRYTYGNTASATLDGTANNQRYFVYLNNVTSLDYQVSWSATSGSSPGPLIKTTSTDYLVDNVQFGTFQQIDTTTTDNDPNSPYSGQQWTTKQFITISPDPSSNWCLTQPVDVTEQRISPGSTITRATSFAPDYSHCRENVKYTAPGTSYAETETYGYDTFGNLSDVTESGVGVTGSRNTHTDWGTTGQFPMAVTNPLSQTTSYSYNFALGFRTSAQDPNGIITSWAPDPFGRKQSETRADGTSTVWTYNDCASAGGCLIGAHGLVIVNTVYNVNQTVQTDGSSYLDAADRPLVSTSRTLAAGAYQRNEVRYDSLGRTAQRAKPCTWTGLAAACPYWTTYSYDLLNRRTRSQRPISSTNGTLQTTLVQYSGRTTTTTDPQGIVSTRITSVDGSMIRSIDNAGYYQNFVYDAFGSLLSVTDSLSNTLFTADYDYGIGAFQRDATDADLDVSTASGQHRTYNYDALGEIVSWSDAKGQSFTQSYDALSRPLVRTEPDLTTSWTWGSSATAHNIGQLQSVAAGSYSESYAYDAVGRLASHSVTIPSDATYEYDLTYNTTTGGLDTLTYPVPAGVTASRLKLQYGYVNGFLSSVTDFNSGTAYWTANAANARNQVTQETLGNGVVTNRSFDAVTGWPSSVTSGVNGATNLQNDSYLFDEAGNVIERQNNNVGLTENFYYDAVYRLDHSTLGSASNVNLQMHYDATGNITSRSDLAGGATWTYDPNRKHAVTQAGNPAFAYTYDQNGNVVSRDGYSVTWTSYNHPSSITSPGESVQFAYRQDHTRWSAVYSGSAGTETTYFIGNLLEKVISVGAVNYRHYIYAGPTKVATYTPTSGAPQVYYVREDHLGSVSGILNSDGTGYVKESFTAFGARRSSCTWSGPPTAGNLQAINAVTRHGFTWQFALGTMGLNDMNGRIEDAVTGRFLSPDPTVPRPRFTQSFNRYSYVNNNPLSLIDPSGFDDGPPIPGCENGGIECPPVPDIEPQQLPEIDVTACGWACNLDQYDQMLQLQMLSQWKALSGLAPTGTGNGSGSASSGGQDASQQPNTSTSQKDVQQCMDNAQPYIGTVAGAFAGAVATGVTTRNAWATLGGGIFGGGAAALSYASPRWAGNAASAFYTGAGVLLTALSASSSPGAALQGLAAAGGISLSNLFGLPDESSITGRIFQYAAGSGVGGTFGGLGADLAVGRGLLGTAGGAAGAATGIATFAAGQFIAKQICQSKSSSGK